MRPDVLTRHAALVYGVSDERLIIGLELSLSTNLAPSI